MKMVAADHPSRSDRLLPIPASSVLAATFGRCASGVLRAADVRTHKSSLRQPSPHNGRLSTKSVYPSRRRESGDQPKRKKKCARPAHFAPGGGPADPTAAEVRARVQPAGLRAGSDQAHTRSSSAATQAAVRAAPPLAVIRASKLKLPVVVAGPEMMAS
jgi:hypothetical protein